MKHFIPENIDVEELVKRNPPFRGFKRDKFIYILGLINKLAKGKEGYARIDTRLLRKYVWNYNQYMNYALNLGIIESNESYLAGRNSKGYRFAKPYGGKLKQMKTDMSFKSAKKENQRVAAPEYLTKWLGGLRIERDKALDKLEELRTSKKKAPKEERYEYQRQIIKDIHNGKFNCWVDKNYRRFHHPVSFMKREIRNFLSYKGFSLVEVDVSNSQPLMAGIIIKDNTIIGNIIQQYIYSTYNINNNKYNNINVSGNSLKDFGNLYEDEKRYLDAVSSGTFYTNFQKCISQYLGEHIPKDQLKREVLKIFYRRNGFYNQYSEVFRLCYPNVFRRFRIIKRGNNFTYKNHNGFWKAKDKDYKRLSYFLGRLESYLFLHQIAKRISREKPNLPFLTVHDAIVTIHGYEEYVKKIIEEEIEGFIKIKPHVKIKEWKLENIEQKEMAA